MLTYFRCVEGKVEKIDRFTPDMFSADPQVLHWIDLDSPTPEEARVLTDPFHFHPLAIENCLEDINHPKVDDYESYIFLTIRAVPPQGVDLIFKTRTDAASTTGASVLNSPSSEGQIVEIPPSRE